MLKKAMFFTMAAIALTLVIVVTYTAYTTYRLSDNMEKVGIRIETVNFFVKDIEKDLSKGVYITGFRTLLSFEQFISKNGTYLDDINNRFAESFLNGTVYQQPLTLMQGSTFTDWANKIAAQANTIGIIFNFTIDNVNINQTDPWNVNIMLNITLSINDKKNTSSWVRKNNLISRISIIGFEDPLYVVNSNGRVTNNIVPSNITSFVVNGDVANLLIHANNSFYIAHNDSPSFLMRLQGTLGNSTAGIESLVNLDKFQQQGIILKDRSIVDSVYFGTQYTTNYRINNTPTWFKIDNNHLDIYQVTNITIP